MKHRGLNTRPKHKCKHTCSICFDGGVSQGVRHVRGSTRELTWKEYFMTMGLAKGSVRGSTRELTLHESVMTMGLARGSVRGSTIVNLLDRSLL